jgi:hypothetical protein
VLPYKVPLELFASSLTYGHATERGYTSPRMLWTRSGQCDGTSFAAHRCLVTGHAVLAKKIRRDCCV